MQALCLASESASKSAAALPMDASSCITCRRFADHHTCMQSRSCIARIHAMCRRFALPLTCMEGRSCVICKCLLLCWLCALCFASLPAWKAAAALPPRAADGVAESLLSLLFLLCAAAMLALRAAKASSESPAKPVSCAASSALRPVAEAGSAPCAEVEYAVSRLTPFLGLL